MRAPSTVENCVIVSGLLSPAFDHVKICDCNPNVDFDSVPREYLENFDCQVSLEQFEERFSVPAVVVDRGDIRELGYKGDNLFGRLILNYITT